MYGPRQLGNKILSPFEMGEEEVPGPVAAQFVQDELLLDGIPALNLAGFATTFMESNVENLMLKNLVRHDKCVSFSAILRRTIAQKHYPS